MAIRAELFYPGTQIIPTSTDFHRIFTVHGTNMLYLWILPFASGVGNYIPITVRYHDMAWPKLNAIAFWMIPVAAAMIWIGFSDTGWTAYPLYSTIRAPGPAADLWIFGAKIGWYFFSSGCNLFCCNYIKMQTIQIQLASNYSS